MVYFDVHVQCNCYQEIDDYSVMPVQSSASVNLFYLVLAHFHSFLCSLLLSLFSDVSQHLSSSTAGKGIYYFSSLQVQLFSHHPLLTPSVTLIFCPPHWKPPLLLSALCACLRSLAFLSSQHTSLRDRMPSFVAQFFTQFLCCVFSPKMNILTSLLTLQLFYSSIRIFLLGHFFFMQQQ